MPRLALYYVAGFVLSTVSALLTANEPRWIGFTCLVVSTVGSMVLLGRAAYLSGSQMHAAQRAVTGSLEEIARLRRAATER